MPRRRIAIVLLAVLATVLSTSPLVAQAVPPKNVLIFFIDDLRPELGCYGVEYIKSPSIDKLAAQGMRFDRAYCQQAICAPSRISMLSGQYPDTNGIYDLLTPLRRTHPDAMTLPRYFRERGYVTASFGKVYHHHADDQTNWTELPDAPGDKYADPATLESIANREKQARAQGLTGTKLSAATKGPAVECYEGGDEAYRDGLVAKQAIESLQRNRDKPFFMAVGFAKPHLPFAAPKRYWDLYERDQFGVPDRNLPEGTPALAVTVWGELRGYTGIPAKGPLTDEQTRELKHGYAASVSFTDAQVGRVLAELERLGLRENTVVVLWGDHGYKLGDYGLWCKHTNLELDTRVPLIISAPGARPGQHSGSLVEVVDVFPTVAALSGGEIPASCEGKSLVPLLTDPARRLRDFALSQYPRGTTMGYSLRTERWRFTEWINVKTGEIRERELYDHQNSSLVDRNAVNDPQYVRLVAELARQLDSSGRARHVPQAKPSVREGEGD
jgi:iduronate 2-sulfatase